MPSPAGREKSGAIDPSAIWVIVFPSDYCAWFATASGILCKVVPSNPVMCIRRHNRGAAGSSTTELNIERVHKMRFGSARRRLGSLPSSCAQTAPPLRSPLFSRPRRRRRRRWLLGSLLGLLAVPLVLLGLLQSGLFAPIIEREAVNSLADLLPESLEAKIEGAEFGVKGLDGIGVSLEKLVLTDKQSGKLVFSTNAMRLGVRAISALRGKPQVRSLSLSGVEIRLPGPIGNTEGIPAISEIHTALGLLFDSTNRLFEQTTVNGSPVGIEISEMRLTGPGVPTGEILVKKAEILARPRQRALNAEISFRGEDIQVLAILSRDSPNDISVSLKADGVPLPIGALRTLFSAVEEDHSPGLTHPPVLASVAFIARRMPGDVPDELTFEIDPGTVPLKLDEGDFVDLSGRLKFSWMPESRVLSLLESPVRFGRSSGVLSGGIRDVSDSGIAGDTRDFQFEILLNDAISNPLDSPEPPVRFAARSVGTIAPEEGKAEISRIEIKSSAGYAEGVGTLDFTTAVPSAIFALSVSDFDLAGVKQFWPGSVARAARRWVLSNLAGGRVVEGDFLIAEPLRRRVEGSDEKLKGDTEVSLRVEGVRFDVAGDIPPVRDANGRVEFKDGETVILLESGTAYLPSGRTADASDGRLVIHPKDENGLVFADMDVKVAGTADALGELISYRPINARELRDYRPEELSGEADARVQMRFALNRREGAPPPDWTVTLDVRNAALSTPFEGRMLSEMSGRIEIDRRRADIDVSGKIDGFPAEISMIMPFGGAQIEASRDILLKLTDTDRQEIAPGLGDIVKGLTVLNVKSGGDDGHVSIDADLKDAALFLPWIGWTKGTGVQAEASFDLVSNDGETRISDFSLDGGSFSARGDITTGPSGVKSARFAKVSLNPTDDISVSVNRKGGRLEISISGTSFDARALIRHIRKELSAKGSGKGTPVDLTAKIAEVQGFGDESLRNLEVVMRHDGTAVTELTASAISAAGFPVNFSLRGARGDRTVRLEALDGGEVLRFLDIYGQIRGGVLTLALSGNGSDRLSGTVDLNDFRVFDEPRLNALVSTKAGESASINEAIGKEIDTREIRFEKASATVSLAPSILEIENAIIRGPEVGATFRGTVYDENEQMRIAGTFMPAYAINSLLSNVPIVGLVLGNGSDRALIGVTFLLAGDAKKPKITVNPLSLIAPGVFRSIFEFR
ncbi:hypothetical protein HTY61_04680 [Oricola thermophila]|uniref:Uncharacterized protein n=1 Tax=Oricola thermophila TaxID=2742145 RepID=A0A6N1VF05_9HYPH|nr:hypothetical protein HTY61_04680 [Oricola thermophila]